ncbi:nucleolar protein 56-like protein, partial [Tanacetum coccineum]
NVDALEEVTNGVVVTPLSMLEELSRAASFDELVRKGNSIRVCVLAMKAWLGLGRYGRTEKDLKVRTRAAIRVVQRVVGDCVTEEGSRVRVKFVGQMTDESRDFLETSLPKVKEGKKPKYSLGVSDSKIGCQSNEFVLELILGIRLHFDMFITNLKPGDLEKAHLGGQFLFMSVREGIMAFYEAGNRLKYLRMKFNAKPYKPGEMPFFHSSKILGAEKALFRALKTKGNTPKYGLIFHSSFIQRAYAKNKGRMARYLANKCSIATRIDCFSGKFMVFVSSSLVWVICFARGVGCKVTVWHETIKDDVEDSVTWPANCQAQVKLEQKIILVYINEPSF